MTQHTHPVRFHGRTGEYFGIWIVNILLSIVTLGIYSAWAKVRTKRYFYGNTELAGDRFDYLATPLQILIGRVISIAILLAWFWLNSFEPVAALVILFLFFALFPILMVRNLRFDMRMTLFRNVRFDFDQAYWEAYIAYLIKPIGAYIAMFIALFVVVFASEFSPAVGGLLGVVAICVGGPYLFGWVTKGMSQFVVDHLRYGERAFSAQLRSDVYAMIAVKTMLFAIAVFVLVFGGGALVAWGLGVDEMIVNSLANFSEPEAATQLGMDFFVGMVLFYALFGLASFLVHGYYAALARNYLFSRTSLGDDLQLSSSMGPIAFGVLEFTNLLGVLFTLGLAQPWAKIRKARFLCNATYVEGDLEALRVRDTAGTQDSAVADELTQALDLDIGVFG
ncbi:MAG: YjgN family protein [Oleiphilaceae bacterium]|nr:YjgN family protein [Oleiphilaceae bacterium]